MKRDFRAWKFETEGLEGQSEFKAFFGQPSDDLATWTSAFQRTPELVQCSRSKSCATACPTGTSAQRSLFWNRADVVISYCTSTKLIGIQTASTVEYFYTNEAPQFWAFNAEDVVLSRSVRRHLLSRSNNDLLYLISRIYRSFQIFVGVSVERLELQGTPMRAPLHGRQRITVYRKEQ